MYACVYVYVYIWKYMEINDSFLGEVFLEGSVIFFCLWEVT